MKNENASQKISTLSLKFSSVPVMFSLDFLYMPFTCWLPGETRINDDLFDWYAVKGNLIYEIEG
jgi:hypothetical protein